MPLTYRYDLTENGDLPISLTQAKDYLKVDNAIDNSIIQDLLATAVQFGERYTGVDYRIKTWALVTDCFEERILLRKSQIATVTSVKYLVGLAPVQVTIATTIWYLKKGRQFSEILLKDGQAWPTDLWSNESGVEIIFKTEVPRYIEEYKTYDTPTKYNIFNRIIMIVLAHCCPVIVS